MTNLLLFRTLTNTVLVARDSFRLTRDEKLGGERVCHGLALLLFRTVTDTLLVARDSTIGRDLGDRPEAARLCKWGDALAAS